MHSLSSFPIITDELSIKVRMQKSPFNFFYIDENGEDHELIAEDTQSNAHPLIDESGRWTPDNFGFGITRDYSINGASFLFGPKGVACSDAKLVLALIWKSPDSRQRSACTIGEIKNTHLQQKFSLAHSFPKPRFKGKLDLQTAVIIKEAGTPMAGETHLANIPGTVLGILDNYALQFDGTGSAFPIMIINNPEGLLWSIDCSIDDPLTDKFTDCVSINLNSAHKDYKFINSADTKNYNPSFLREVLANAVATIVDYLRGNEFWDSIRNGKAEEDSIGQVVYYFIETLGLNLDDAKQCSYAFRDYFEKKLGEI